MSRFPFFCPCFWAAASGFPSPQKQHVVKSLCRDTALFFLWKKGAPVLWWPGGCRAACCQSCSSSACSNQPGSREKLSPASPLFNSAAPLPLSSQTWAQHQHKSLWKEAPAWALLLSSRTSLCFTFPLSCWEDVKGGWVTWQIRSE